MRARTSSGSAASEAAVKPTRSQKRTDTTLRSSARAAAGCSVSGARAERAERKLARELLAAGGAGRHPPSLGQALETDRARVAAARAGRPELVLHWLAGEIAFDNAVGEAGDARENADVGVIPRDIGRPPRVTLRSRVGEPPAQEHASGFKPGSDCRRAAGSACMGRRAGRPQDPGTGRSVRLRARTYRSTPTPRSYAIFAPGALRLCPLRRRDDLLINR